MQISLVVCTRNREAQLPRALRALANLQCAEPWELVLVDNGSSDATPSVIADFAATFIGKVTAVREERAGLARARNAGVKAASGRLVAFTDDDCYPREDYLQRIIAAFHRNPRAGYVGGRVLLHDPEDYRLTLQECAEQYTLPARSYVHPGSIHGANFAFRRDVLQSLGGFDPMFGAGALFACEDVDMMARASAAGWEGSYDPEIVVWHHHGRRTMQDVENLTRIYDRGRGAYFAKSLLDPVIRRPFAAAWLGRMRQEPWRSTAREICAAAEYLARRAFLRR